MKQIHPPMICITQQKGHSHDYFCVAFIKIQKEVRELDLLEMLNELRTTLKTKKNCHCKCLREMFN